MITITTTTHSTSLMVDAHVSTSSNSDCSARRARWTGARTHGTGGGGRRRTHDVGGGGRELTVQSLRVGWYDRGMHRV